METEIVMTEKDNLESVVYTLLAARARGEHAYCIYYEHVFHSDSVSMDSAFMEVMGCTKEEYEQRKFKEWKDAYTKKEEERINREQDYVEKVKKSRTEEIVNITEEKVIQGLKFIAENQSISQEDLVNGLIELGCNFTIEEIKQQFPEEIQLYEGFNQGNIACGASIIANMRDSESGRSYCKDRFLSKDDDVSVYHFIRIKTGDEAYTKENLEAPRRAI